MKLSITSYILCDRPIDDIFHSVLTLNPSLLFDQCDASPRIVSTSNTEKWLRPGTKRKLYSDKGIMFTETLLKVIPEQSFSSEININSCQISKYTKSLSISWQFIEEGHNKTKIAIRCTFRTNGLISWLFLILFYKSKFLKYLKAATLNLSDVFSKL